MKQNASILVSARSHAMTLGQVLKYFSRPGRVFMLPLLVFLFVSGLLLLATGGLSYAAPFVYAVF